jgi:O-antigen/teichoic acid export membrane protein
MRALVRRLDSEHRSFIGGTAALMLFAGSGQLIYLLALPAISRIYSASDFGVFTIYMAILNMAAPVANLKLERALYSADDGERRDLVLATSLVVSAMMAALLGLMSYVVLGLGFITQASSFNVIVDFLPAGILLSALWDVTTAWAVKFGQVKTLAAARFAQPVVMAVCHLSMGWLGWGWHALLGGSVMAYAAYAGIILLRPTNWRSLRRLGRFKLREIAQQAYSEREFAIYSMPSQLVLVALTNLPQILVGIIFGRTAAGHFGLAYRIVAAPPQILCIPLSNMLTTYLSDASRSKRRSMILLVPAIAFLFVSLPLVALAVLAPLLSGVVFPASWTEVSAYIQILAILSAMQAIVQPFYETYGVLRRQRQGLMFSIIRLPLVLVGLLLPAYLGYSDVIAVAAMSGGSIFGLFLMFIDALRAALSTTGSRGGM